MVPRIVLVDYQKGNLKSVERGLTAAGADVLVTADADTIVRADAVVLPGVGAFADAAATMSELGQMDAVRERIAAGTAFLGICLGMHLMFEEGTEGAPQEDDETSTHNAQGLAVLPGVVARIPQVDQKGLSYKVPHVGWNSIVPPACQPAELLDAAASPGTRSRGDAAGSRTEVRFASAIPTISGTGETLADPVGPASFACPLFAGIDPGEYFYFTHSYVAPNGPFVVAETTHSVTFPSAVQYGDVAFGVQFHPEKSSDVGAAVLRNFVNIVKGA